MAPRCGSGGRAPASGAGGRWFKSSHSDHISTACLIQIRQAYIIYIRKAALGGFCFIVKSGFSAQPLHDFFAIAEAKDQPFVRSPLESKVRIFSFWNRHSQPASLSCLMVVRLSTVFLANRLTDLVTMRSILPARASSIMRLKPSRCWCWCP